MSARISAMSTEFVKVPVYAKDQSVITDPTIFEAEMAVVSHLQKFPLEADWRPATWITIGSSYFTQIEVGPEAGDPLVMTPGDWLVWVRISATPEKIVKQAPGSIVVY
jgi:hypothetical protein